MERMISWARNNGPAVLFALLLTVPLMACRAAGVPPAAREVILPQEARLQERIKAFHDALGNNDIATWYAMTAPAIRKRMTFDQFKKDIRWEENSGRRTQSTLQAQLLRSCNCEQYGDAVRCVLAVNVTVTESGKKPRTESPLEMWEYSDGQWYWGYIGPDTGGRCPGEK
jgi:hypothetical protein